MSTTTRPSPPAPEDDPLLAWLGTPYVRVATIRKHGRWYAVAEDFDIAGMGENEIDAIRNLVRLVDAYLRSCQRAGFSYAEALRPTPRRVRIGYRVAAALRRVFPGRAPWPVGRETSLVLPEFLRDLRTVG